MNFVVESALVRRQNDSLDETVPNEVKDFGKKEISPKRSTKPFHFTTSSSREPIHEVRQHGSLSLDTLSGSTVSRKSLNPDENIASASISDAFPSFEELPHPSKLFRKRRRKCVDVKKPYKIPKNDVQHHLQKLKNIQAKWDLVAAPTLSTDEVFTNKTFKFEDGNKSNPNHTNFDKEARVNVTTSAEAGDDFVFKPKLMAVESFMSVSDEVDDWFDKHWQRFTHKTEE